MQLYAYINAFFDIYTVDALLLQHTIEFEHAVENPPCVEACPSPSNY